MAGVFSSAHFDDIDLCFVETFHYGLHNKTRTEELQHAPTFHDKPPDPHGLKRVLSGIRVPVRSLTLNFLFDVKLSGILRHNMLGFVRYPSKSRDK